MSELIFYFSRHCLFATEGVSIIQWSVIQLSGLCTKTTQAGQQHCFFGDEWHIIAAAKFSDMGLVLGPESCL